MSAENIENPTNNSINNINENPTAPTNNNNQNPTAPINNSNENPTAPVNNSDQNPTAPINNNNQNPTAPVNNINEKPTAPINNINENPTAPINNSNENQTVPINDSNRNPTAPINNINENPTVPINNNNQNPTVPIINNTEQQPINPPLENAIKDDNNTPPKTEEEKILEGQFHSDKNNQPANNGPIIEISGSLENIPPKKSDYLRDKMSKMNINSKIVNSVNKSLGKQMKNVENNIINDQILITKVKKDVNSIIKKTKPSSSKELENKNKVVVSKSQLKQIKDLKTDRDILLNKLMKINSNVELLLETDKNSEKLKNLEKQKKSIETRISQINIKIDKILTNQKKNEDINVNRKERIKSFYANFENDKEKIENRAKKYIEESKAREQRRANDLEQITEKVKKEMDEKIKEAELHKENILKKFKEQEKAIENKRREQNCNTYNKYKPFMRNKNKNIDYLFVKKYKNYLDTQENIIKTENLKRKQLMRSLDFNGINEFEKNYMDNKEKKLSQLNENKKNLINEWKERKKTLEPVLNNQKKLLNTESENFENEDEEDSKKKQIEILNQKKIDYSIKVKEKKIPAIDEKLKEERINKIKALENPKERILNENKIKLHALALNKIKVNKSQEMKLKNMKIHVIIKNTSTPREQPVQRDYLAEMRNKREDSEVKLKENVEKWNKEINNNKRSLADNINKVRKKAEAMQTEAISKEKVMRLNGGIQNNIKLGNKISKLIIDSIEAKLSILSKLNEE